MLLTFVAINIFLKCPLRMHRNLQKKIVNNLFYIKIINLFCLLCTDIANNIKVLRISWEISQVELLRQMKCVPTAGA